MILLEIKEALLEKWKTGKITSVYVPDLKALFKDRIHNAVDFRDGNLVILFARTGNITTFGEDIEHRL